MSGVPLDAHKVAAGTPLLRTADGSAHDGTVVDGGVFSACRRQQSRRAWPAAWVGAAVVLLLVVAAAVCVAVWRRPQHGSTSGRQCVGSEAAEVVVVASEAMAPPGAWAAAVGAAHVIDQDGLVAVPLNDSHSLWLFSDTIMNCTSLPSVCTPWDWAMISNSAAVLSRDVGGAVAAAQYVTALQYAPGFPQQVVPFQSNQPASAWALWPSSSVAVNGTTRVFWSTVQRLAGGGPWAFQAWGAGSGILHVHSVHNVSVERDVDASDERWHVAPTAIVVQAAVPGAHCFAFLYFLRGTDLVVACGSPPGVLSPSQPDTMSTFWDGTAWNTTYNQSAPAAQHVRSAHVSITFDVALQRLLMAGVELFASSVHIRSARTPQGPFSCAHTVFSADPAAGWLYFPAWHPELAPPPSLLPLHNNTPATTVVLSFSRSTTQGWVVPQFARVTLRPNAARATSTPPTRTITPP